MKEIDENLKEALEEFFEKVEPLSDKLIKTLKKPKYTSGKNFKYGDRPIAVLIQECGNAEIEVKPYPEFLKKLSKKNGKRPPTVSVAYKNKQKISSLLSEQLENPYVTEISLRLIIIHEDEIKQFCKEYLFISEDNKAVRVIKRPENF